MTIPKAKLDEWRAAAKDLADEQEVEVVEMQDGRLFIESTEALVSVVSAVPALLDEVEEARLDSEAYAGVVSDAKGEAGIGVGESLVTWCADARSLLREIEWSGPTVGMVPTCPRCRGMRPCEGARISESPDFRVGHAPDCRLAAFLK